MEALSDLELRELANGLRDRLEEGETPDDLLPESFAATREAARRSLGQRHFDVQLLGGAVPRARSRRCAPAKPADGHPRRGAERVERSRRSRGDGQRLPRQTRHAVDGSGLRRARSVGRLYQHGKAFIYDADWVSEDERLERLTDFRGEEAYEPISPTARTTSSASITCVTTWCRRSTAWCSATWRMPSSTRSTTS